MALLLQLQDMNHIVSMNRAWISEGKPFEYSHWALTYRAYLNRFVGTNGACHLPLSVASNEQGHTATDASTKVLQPEVAPNRHREPIQRTGCFENADCTRSACWYGWNRLSFLLWHPTTFHLVRTVPLYQLLFPRTSPSLISSSLRRCLWSSCARLLEGRQTKTKTIWEETIQTHVHIYLLCDLYKNSPFI